MLSAFSFLISTHGYSWQEYSSTVMPMLKCALDKAFMKRECTEVYENGHLMYENVRKWNFTLFAGFLLD